MAWDGDYKDDSRSQLPEQDAEFIRRAASMPDGEALAKEYADAGHASHNNYSATDAQQNLKAVKADVVHADEEHERALKQRGQLPPYRFIKTTEPHHEKAGFPLFQFITIGFPALIGVPLISTTFAALITKSGKFDFLFEYPYLSLMFIFVPISLMVLIGHQYGELRQEDQRVLYRRYLYCMIVPLAVIWVSTLLPAYAPPQGDSGNLLADDIGNSLVFLVHLTIQIFLEILVGGALKCAVFDVMRSFQKSIPVRDETYKAACRHVIKTMQRLTECLNRLSKIHRYIADHEGTRLIHTARVLALFYEFKSTADAQEKFITATGQLAEARAVLELSKQTDETEE